MFTTRNGAAPFCSWAGAATARAAAKARPSVVLLMLTPSRRSGNQRPQGKTRQRLLLIGQAASRPDVILGPLLPLRGAPDQDVVEHPAAAGVRPRPAAVSE